MLFTSSFGRAIITLIAARSYHRLTDGRGPYFLTLKLTQLSSSTILLPVPTLKFSSYPFYTPALDLQWTRIEKPR